MLIDSHASSFNKNVTANDSMYLGQWRNQILNKLNPRYFNQLLIDHSAINNIQFTNHINYKQNSNRFLVPVFSNSNFSFNNDLAFSFVSDNMVLTPFAFNQILSELAPRNQFSNQKSLLDPMNQASLVEQQYFTPGYVYSKGSSSFGVAAIFVQQRFLDDSFSLLSLASSSNSQLYSDKAFINSNRGTGYQFSYNQKLFSKMNIGFNYQSEINMNEFGSYGRSYSQKGDFDIPSHMTMIIGLPFLKSNEVKFSAEKITYSRMNTTVHSGYSEAFLNAFNSLISPVFKLDDLLVYSISLQRKVSDNLSWNIDVTSRQQAPATRVLYNNILKNDTAAYSYKIGLKHKAGIGEFNVFASFANKPIMVGTTDFGRLSSTSLNNHIEGVLSWSMSF